MLDLETKKLPFGIIIEICYLRGQVQFWTTHKLVNVGELVSIGMKAGVVEIQCLIMLVKFTKCILIKLAFTEGCVENLITKLHWANGERYGKSMIHDFGTVGWTDWNIFWTKTEGLIM
jgi:hypothetical protein